MHIEIVFSSHIKTWAFNITNINITINICKNMYNILLGVQMWRFRKSKIPKHLLLQSNSCCLSIVLFFHTFPIISKIQIGLYLGSLAGLGSRSRSEPEPVGAGCFWLRSRSRLKKNEEPEPLGKKSQELEPEPVKISRLLSPARR